MLSLMLHSCSTNALLARTCPAHEVFLGAMIPPPVVCERDNQPEPEVPRPVHGVVDRRPSERIKYQIPVLVGPCS
jgi:hypothetical protein